MREEVKSFGRRDCSKRGMLADEINKATIVKVGDYDSILDLFNRLKMVRLKNLMGYKICNSKLL